MPDWDQTDVGNFTGQIFGRNLRKVFVGGLSKGRSHFRFSVANVAADLSSVEQVSLFKF